MSESSRRLRLPIGLVLSLLVSFSVALGTGLITWLNYQRDIATGEKMAEQSLVSLAAAGAHAIEDLDNRGEQRALSMVADHANRQALALSDPPPGTRDMTRLMHPNDKIFSLFVGHPNGDYLEISNLDAEQGLREAWDAQPEDRWILVRILDEPGRGRIEHREYLRADLSVRTDVTVSSDYRANTRPWFKQAIIDRVTTTAPYTLSITGTTGLSHVIATEDGYVVGAITLLSSLNELLKARRFKHSYYAAIFDRDGNVIADSSGEAGADTALQKEKLDRLIRIGDEPSNFEKLVKTDVADSSNYAFVAPLAGTDGDTENSEGFVGLIVAADEVLEESIAGAKRGITISLMSALLLIPLAMVAAREISRPIGELGAMTDRIRKRQYDDIKPIQSSVKEVRWLSKSLVEMASVIKEYQIKQRELNNSTILLISGAIDQKSPYTGGHCTRVPDIGMMLAQAASDASSGPFKDFAFEDEEAWREFRVAAWLHDCGKITTPEHIVDKGSKLEAIYNRIHEVRMRFEVLLRDAEIEFWKALSEQPDNKTTLEQKLSTQRQQIIDDFSFIAECKVGGEMMNEERLNRLQEIARQTWQRNLDDRLGLSPAETNHLEQFPATPTPAMEPLLADRPEHIFVDSTAQDRYEGLGFTMQAPEHKANQGELYNLSIGRGTLTEEDRYIINEHIAATIKMLEAMPWPEELAKVPEYAGGHHEKIDGTGYPRSLPGDALSIPAKILAVADVLEALTASDRPYKSAKTLSISLKIMADMARTGHLDPELFRLLIETKVYRQYAEAYLPAEQVDFERIDEAQLLEGL